MGAGIGVEVVLRDFDSDIHLGVHFEDMGGGFDMGSWDSLLWDFLVLALCEKDSLVEH